MLKPLLNEIRKPTKTISGITPVAVMLLQENANMEHAHIVLH